MRTDLKALGDAVIASVKGYVAEIVATVSTRLDGLEKRITEIPAGEKGADGIDGKDGKDGVDGKDGSDGRDGKDGEPGRDGKDGEPGKSVELADVKALLEGTHANWVADWESRAQNAIKQAVESIPAPKDGADGKDGKDGADGKSVVLGEVMAALENHHAKWALEWERRANDVLTKAVDNIALPRDGKDGKDGRDGLSFDDVQIEHDGERTVKIRLARGEFAIERAIKLPAVLDRGIFKESDYERGDGVTWNGSFWIAQKDAPKGKPGEPGSDGWRLSVKKGRDGRDGRDGIDKTASVSL